WLDGERRRLQREVRTAWERQSDEARARGDLDLALLGAEQVLALDPFDEPALRRVMQRLAERGNAAGALARFATFREQLRQELGGAPTAETLALVERLRTPPPAAAPAVQPPLSHQDVPPSPPVDAARPAPRPLARSRRTFVLAGVAIAALLAIASVPLRRPAPTLGASRPVTVDEGLQIEPSLAPNGRLVAFARGDAQRMRIHVARLDGSASWPLTTDSTSVELLPRWSPESDEILFLSGDHAWVSPAVGGPARRVA